MTETALDMAERHVREGQERLREQELLLDQLAERGPVYLIGLANQLLRSMQDFQRIAEEHRDLLRELQ